jgi:hypothetical protein
MERPPVPEVLEVTEEQLQTAAQMAATSVVKGPFLLAQEVEVALEVALEVEF